MSSRKTYFGIGWTGKNPNAATEKSQDGGDDRSDYSAPTVVDDEKVAEGLKQLRAWYQPDDGVPDQRMSVVEDSSEPTKLGMPYPRPTAVGRSESMPMENTRPVVPDPMRGTMFGHDVHRPEIEEALRERSQWALVPAVPPTEVKYEADMLPPTPAAADEAQFSSMGSHAEPLRRHAVPVRTPEAETDAILVRRGKTAGRLAIAGVMAACGAVVIFAWYQVRGGGEETTTRPPPPPTTAPANPAVAAPPPAPPATATATATAPARPGAPAADRGAPAVARPPVPAAPARAPRVADRPTPAVQPEAPATTTTATASASRSRRSERRAATQAAAAATEVDSQPAPEEKEKPKPVERRREAPAPRVEDDDATLPPSVE
jgi:hypothetical protein